MAPGSKPRCLGVITARSGSKGVPGKNIRPIGGRPLLSYAIDVALACPHIDRTVVTTDSDAIRGIALARGAEAPFLRPAELATDTARQEDAILHAMRWYASAGERFDEVCLVEPTAPLRQVETLNRGFDLLRADTRTEAVLSVTECGFSPQFCNTLRPDGFMKAWMPDEEKWANRQELPPYYRVASLVAISRWEAFERTETFLHDATRALVVDPVEATEIDTPLDLFVAERLVEHGIRCFGDLDARRTNR